MIEEEYYSPSPDELDRRSKLVDSVPESVDNIDRKVREISHSVNKLEQSLEAIISKQNEAIKYLESIDIWQSEHMPAVTLLLARIQRLLRLLAFCVVAGLLLYAIDKFT